MQTCTTFLDQYKGINNDCCTLFKPKHKKYFAQAEAALGHALPLSFKDFYAQTDGLQFSYWNRSRSLNGATRIFPIRTVFGGWKPKKNGSLGTSPYSDWTIEVFKGSLWFENDKRIRSIGDFNRIKTLKVLQSIPGESSWITIHFRTDQHQLYLVTETQILPLSIDFQTYLDLTFKYCGLEHWWALYLEEPSQYSIDYKKLRRNLDKFAHL